MSAPDFSVIVIFGRGATEPALGSLLAQENADFEIIGVAPDDRIAVADPRVKLAVVPDPNPARRRNLAAAKAAGKYLAFIDDDASAPKDWLAKAKSIFETKPDLAAFGGPNLAPEKMSWPQQLVELILTDQYFGSGGKSYQRSGVPRPARPGELHSSNLFIRREFFERVKGFNEKIGYGAEDSEMLYHLKQIPAAGLGFFPDLFVVHQRRGFGIEYLKRGFRFRRQNGRLILLHPDMYAWNRPLLAGMAAAGLGLLLLVTMPLPAFLLFIFYLAFFCAFSLARLKKNRMLALLAPFAYLLHHLAYSAGIAAGVAEGLVKGREAMSKAYGRQDFKPNPNSDNLS